MSSVYEFSIVINYMLSNISVTLRSKLFFVVNITLISMHSIAIYGVTVLPIYRSMTGIYIYQRVQYIHKYTYIYILHLNINIFIYVYVYIQGGEYKFSESSIIRNVEWSAFLQLLLFKMICFLLCTITALLLSYYKRK